MLNCCSQDNSTNSRSDCTLTKLNNEVDNNQGVKDNQNNDNNNITNDNKEQEHKGGSARIEKKIDNENKPAPVSGFRRTKTKHFK